MQFRPLELSDRDWIERCRNESRTPFSALTFSSLITWAETYGMTVAGDDDFFVIRSRHDKAYYMPCGQEEKCLAFMEAIAEKEHPARFLYIEETRTGLLAERGWQQKFRADLSEYILSSAALALEPDTFVTHSFRYKCRHFGKASPYRAREITPEDVPLLREIAAKAAPPAVLPDPGDERVLSFELDHLRELEFRGVLVETADGPSAYFLGYERDPAVFTMTMFRRDAALSGDVTAVCVHEFAKILLPRYQQINIEEDLGLQGLRIEKNMFSPIDLLKVYEVLK